MHAPAWFPLLHCLLCPAGAPPNWPGKGNLGAQPTGPDPILSHLVLPCPALPCSTSGPNLRRLYLPGLEGLKAELRKLEFLLDRYLPNLTAHLNVCRGVCTRARSTAGRRAGRDRPVWATRSDCM